jgi:hypothetical protein
MLTSQGFTKLINKWHVNNNQNKDNHLNIAVVKG